jgi:hypothetical protein
MVLLNSGHLFDLAHSDIRSQPIHNIVVGPDEQDTGFTSSQGFVDSPGNKFIPLLQELTPGQFVPQSSNFPFL